MQRYTQLARSRPMNLMSPHLDAHLYEGMALKEEHVRDLPPHQSGHCLLSDVPYKVSVYHARDVQ